MKWYGLGLVVLAALAIGVLAPAQKMLTLYMPGETMLGLFGWSLTIGQFIVVLCAGAAIMAVIITLTLVTAPAPTGPNRNVPQLVVTLGGAVLPLLGILAGLYSEMITRIAAEQTNTTNLAVLAPGRAAALFGVSVCAAAGFVSLACGALLHARRGKAVA